ncbi:MAG: hypothetical protein FWE03_05235 [Firmicutes bacterium]|nr:hypothetical protein [Bacillota bacterium]
MKLYKHKKLESKENFNFGEDKEKDIKLLIAYLLKELSYSNLKIKETLEILEKLIEKR